MDRHSYIWDHPLSDEWSSTLESLQSFTPKPPPSAVDKEFIEMTLKETATAPVAMDLDQIKANSPQLAAFVADQVIKSTDKLRCQVSQLQKKQQQKPPVPKTRSKGATASTTHNNNKKDAPKPHNTRRNAQKANYIANGSSNAKQNKGEGKQCKKNIHFKTNATQRVSK
jgi:hypothetical protein